MWRCLDCSRTDSDDVSPALCDCGALDSYERVAPRARSAVELADGPDPERIPTGDVDFDRLLLGGIARGAPLLPWGRGGTGKSRCSLRWATRLGSTLCIALEMSPELTAKSARDGGADLEQLHIIDTVDGWESEAHGARAIVLDSISYYFETEGLARSVALLKSFTAWCERTGGNVFAVCHATKGGRFAGPSYFQHWPDYELRFSKAKRSGTAKVFIPKSRYCGSGGAVVPTHFESKAGRALGALSDASRPAPKSRQLALVPASD